MTSFSNSTDVIDESTHHGSKILLVILVIIYSIVVACSVGSNITILLSVFRKLVPLNSVNVCFGSLAISDLMMTILSPLLCHAYFSDIGWVFGNFICQLERYLLEVNFTASTLTLVVISAERYLLICHPQRKRSTLKMVFKRLLVVWGVSLLVNCPLFHGYVVHEETNEENRGKLVCAHEGWSKQTRMIYYSIYACVMYLLPMSIMTFTHIKMTQTINKNERKQKQSRANTPLGAIKQISVPDNFKVEEDTVCSEYSVTSRNDHFELKPINATPATPATDATVFVDNKKRLKRRLTQREKRINAVRTLFVVSVIFFVLWSPFIVMRLMVNADVSVNAYIYEFSQILILSSTAVNGFVYAYMSPAFRKSFRIVLTCKKSTGNTNR